jgi:hypothetical protein
MHVLTQEESSVLPPAATKRGEAETLQESIEMLTERQECPFCHFAKLEREGNEIFCPVGGYGRSACT